jgi:hypothetical protein
VSLLAATTVAACTWLVSFKSVHEAPCDGGQCSEVSVLADSSFDSSPFDSEAPDLGLLDVEDGEAGSCDEKADGAACGTDDACHDTPTCAAGTCTLHEKPDGTPCAAATDACHSVPLCSKGVCGPSTAFPEGTQWHPGDDNARCCSGKPIETTSNTNCGVCGVTCNTGKKQSCGPLNGHYFCMGCALDPDCWSGCCSLTNAPHCSPSNCNSGACNVPDVCPAMSHCQSDVVNYCSY